MDYMDYEEALRIITLLVNRPWVKSIEPVETGELSVETSDGEVWSIVSPLSYARLLYFYECGQKRH